MKQTDQRTHVVEGLRTRPFFQTPHQVANPSILTVMNSTISGNTADFDGGGFLNFFGGNFTLKNSTISGNDSSSGLGGGYLGFGDSSTLINSTITANEASPGGGIVLANASTTITNTIIANNPLGEDCLHFLGVVTSGGHNLHSDSSCIGVLTDSSDIVGDPLLDPLADNLGPTLTHALSLGSPAIDPVDPSDRPARLRKRRRTLRHWSIRVRG
jgi:hypothetical protein